MRLYNIYYLCKQCEDVIKDLQMTSTPDKAFKIERWEEYKKSLSLIRKIDFLTEDAESCYASIPVFIRNVESPLIDGETRNTLAEKNTKLLTKIQAVIELYESMNLGNGESGIDIKIPACNNLEEYISYLKDINFIFTQCPFFQCGNELLKFQSVDIGSNWLKFVVTTSTAATLTFTILSNVAAVADKALTVKSHYISLLQQEEMLETMELKNEIAQQTQEVFDMMKKQYMQQAISELETELGQLHDGEERGKAEKSLEKLCLLLDKGVELYASLDTPQEVQVLFPALEETLTLPDDLVKYLEDKSKVADLQDVAE